MENLSIRQIIRRIFSERIEISTIIFITALMSPPAPAKILVDRKCDPRVTTMINKYAFTILSNLDLLETDFSYTQPDWSDNGVLIHKPFKMRLTREEQDRIYNRVMTEDLFLSCPENGDRLCETKHGEAGAIAIPHWNILSGRARIAICNSHYEHYWYWGSCRQLGSIFHEIGHMAHLPQAPYHSNWNSPEFRRRYDEDKVYQFGKAVEMFCRDGLGVKDSVFFD